MKNPYAVTAVFKGTVTLVPDDLSDRGVTITVPVEASAQVACTYIIADRTLFGKAISDAALRAAQRALAALKSINLYAKEKASGPSA